MYSEDMSSQLLSFLKNNDQFTFEQLLKTELKEDVIAVSEWLNSTNIIFKLKKIDIKKFEKQIEEMYKTYPMYPEDSERTEKILKLFKKGSDIYPVFVEEKDDNLFILEGRHRAVSQWLFNQENLYVLFVSIV